MPFFMYAEEAADGLNRLESAKIMDGKTRR